MNYIITCAEAAEAICEEHATGYKDALETIDINWTCEVCDDKTHASTIKDIALDVANIYCDNYGCKFNNGGEPNDAYDRSLYVEFKYDDDYNYVGMQDLWFDVCALVAVTHDGKRYEFTGR